MGGGSISIAPRLAEPGPVPHGAGNALLYGATGGRLFVAGTVGQRFAVRNSGGVAVVEGCSDHGCEYMTGGAVAVLGPVGRNLAAGMTGGVLFLWDPDGVAPLHLSDTAPVALRPEASDLDELRVMVAEHADRTGSVTAGEILDRWDRASEDFWVLRASRPILTRLTTADATQAS